MSPGGNTPVPVEGAIYIRYHDEVDGYIRQLQVKLVDALNQIPFPVKAAFPEATYLLWTDFRGTGWSQDEFQRFLVEDAGLGSNRGDSFDASGSGFSRINCAVAENRIDEAKLRLETAFAIHYGNNRQTIIKNPAPDQSKK